MENRSLSTRPQQGARPPQEMLTLRTPSGLSKCENTGSLILSQALSTETRQTLMTEIELIERALNCSPRPSAIDRARAMLAAALQGRADSEADAEVERLIWEMALLDVEMNGYIPDWVIEDTTRQYIAGQHGKWRPKPAEFIAVAKTVIAKWRWAAVQRRRLLDAKIVPPIVRASPERVKALFEQFKRGLPSAEQADAADDATGGAEEA